VCSAVHTCTVYVELHLLPSVTSRGVYVACCSPTRTVAHAQYTKRQIASIMIVCTKKQMVFIAISLLLVCMACCPPSCTCLDF
jgi:hypothetical protein